MSSGSSNFYANSGPTSRKSAPPPPPKPSGPRPTSAARRINASKMGARSNYQSNRSIASNNKPSSGNAPKLSSRTGATRLGTTTTSSSSSTANTMRARKAPVASRPVGSYYNSAAATSTETSATTTTSSSFGASNPYAAPAATATTTTSDDDNWDDWGTPSKPSTTTSNTAAASSNPASSWAAPAPAPAAASTTNDWYSAPSTTTTTANTGYTSSGFGNASANTTTTTTTTTTTPGYASSGFGNQPQQTAQQQQQAAPMQPGTGFFQTNTSSQQLSGAMDSSAPTMMSSANTNPTTTNPQAGAPAGFDLSSISTFIPSSIMTPQQPQGPNDPAYPPIEDEAPLLEELGINIQHMMLKSKAVAFPFSRFGGDQIDPTAICQDGEVVGPVCLLLLLGGEMVLTGKLQFGYIYIYGLMGCIAITFVVNLISPTESVSFWTVLSIMGYALLPVNILALVKIFVVNLINLQTLGNILGGLTVVWSTSASTRLLELGCGLRDQRYLIMYPLLLFYSAFVMMTIL